MFMFLEQKLSRRARDWRIVESVSQQKSVVDRWDASSFPRAFTDCQRRASRN